MRVFVAGATGVLGRPTVRLLVAAGHDVTGIARSPERAAQLIAAGATPVTADLFDAAALVRAAAGHDAVINLATHIPSSARGALPGSWAENDRIRSQGSGSLVDAAIAAGAQRYVQESIVLLYADAGDQWIDEDCPLGTFPVVRSLFDAEANAQRATDAGLAGVVLRFGLFHGPEGVHTRDFITSLRRGVCPSIGDPEDFVPVIAGDDAAAAVVAALDIPAGIYNVVDDEPLRRGEYCKVLAAGVGRDSARLPPRAVGRLGKVRHLSQSLRVSNRRLKEVSAWRPQYPSIRSSWPAAVRGYSEDPRQ